MQPRLTLFRSRAVPEAELGLVFRIVELDDVMCGCAA